MLKWFYKAALLSLALSVALCWGGEDLAPLPVIEVVARVYSEHISTRDVEKRMGMTGAKLLDLKERLQASGAWDVEAQKKYEEMYWPLFQEKLRELIREALLLHEFKMRKLELDRHEFEREVRTRVADLRAKGWLGPNGMLESEVREDVQREMRLDMAESDCLNVKLPTRREIEAYYAAHLQDYPQPAGVKLRRFRVPRFETDALGRTKVVEGASEQAEDWRKQATRENFADLVRGHSKDDAECLKQGGLVLGRDGDAYQAYDALPQALSGVLRGIEVGGITPVYTCDDRAWGFALVEARREAGTRPLDQRIHQAIKRTLATEAVHKAERKWLEGEIENGAVRDADGKPYPREFFFKD